MGSGVEKGLGHLSERVGRCVGPWVKAQCRAAVATLSVEGGSPETTELGRCRRAFVGQNLTFLIQFVFHSIALFISFPMKSS